MGVEKDSNSIFFNSEISSSLSVAILLLNRITLEMPRVNFIFGINKNIAGLEPARYFYNNLV